MDRRNRRCEGKPARDQHRLDLRDDRAEFEGDGTFREGDRTVWTALKGSDQLGVRYSKSAGEDLGERIRGDELCHRCGDEILRACRRSPLERTEGRRCPGRETECLDSREELCCEPGNIHLVVDRRGCLLDNERLHRWILGKRGEGRHEFVSVGELNPSPICDNCSGRKKGTDGNHGDGGQRPDPPATAAHRSLICGQPTSELGVLGLELLDKQHLFFHRWCHDCGRSIGVGKRTRRVVRRVECTRRTTTVVRPVRGPSTSQTRPA